MMKQQSLTESLLFYTLLVLVLTFGTGITAQAQFRIAPITSIGDTITCHVGAANYQLRPDQSLISSISLNGKTAETQEIFDKVAGYTELYSNIYTVPVLNKINVEICPGDVNYIAYNADWLNTLYKETNNQWALYAVIAHEIGHYVRGHDRISIGSEPGLELEADEYAGEVLAKMGASLEDAQAAYRSSIMQSQQDHTHPPIAARLKAVERGWRKVGRANSPASGSSGTNGISESRTTYIEPGPVELKDSVYGGGPNNEFEFKFKISTVKFNTDSSLRKATNEIMKQSGTHVWNNNKYYWKQRDNKDTLLLAWKNLTDGSYGWLAVESYNGYWFYKTNGDEGKWRRLERGQKNMIRWNSSGQMIVILLYAPNLSNVWTAEDIQYSFVYSN